MQKRRASRLNVVGERTERPRVVRLSADPTRPAAIRKKEGYICRDGTMPSGFAWQVLIGDGVDMSGLSVPDGSAVVCLPSSFDHLTDGDVVCIGAERGDLFVLFQRSARHNSILLTERCNHYCLMCSQPPKDVDDDWIVDDVMAAIPQIAEDTAEIGFTGGEPTLLGDRLVALIQQCKSYLPRTALHILTNGRSFVDAGYVERIARVGHPDLMFGIPIYSDLSEVHDYVVQADGAFDETIRGILNLKSKRLLVEIRVVVHKQTYERLPDLARFIARNLTFVDQVVFMGLEITGFTRANLKDLWIDPVEYQPQLVDAVEYLADSRIKTSVYNHQLCITDRRLWKYARRSISDWKNEYFAECAHCAVRPECGGFFSSAHLKRSAHIKPVSDAELK
jgi:His-Xaa-Ser system radical SAM maturase HxsC